MDVSSLHASFASIRLPGQEHDLLGLWLPFGLLGVIAWTVWIGRRFLTARYSPTRNHHREAVSVVAPVFREDPEVLVNAVRSWLVAGAEEIVLVFPEDEPDSMEHARGVFAGRLGLRVLSVDDPAKRNSLTVGIGVTTQAIVVLSDSDTLWEPDLLSNLLMPFADPEVGGVGTRQRVLDASSSVWRRAADWMLDAKYLTYIPAMSRRGGVSCLSGRTVAYRRQLLLDVLPDLNGETFWGRPCVSGDDGRLTWLVLNAGYKTVYQRNAVAWTMMPNTARGFFMQRVRWARNSYRCYLRAVFRGWLFRQPMITRVSVLQGLLAPLSLTVGFCFAGLAVGRGDWIAFAVWLGWITCGRGIRAFDHLRQSPRNLVLLPLMTALILFALTAMKYFAFCTMNRQAWVTRREDRGLVEGQSAGSVAAMTVPTREATVP